MTRRPICLVCLFLIFFLCLGDWLGFSLIRGNPLPESLQEWVKSHPQVSICGEVESCTETENSQLINLKQTYLIYQSQKFPIENVRVYTKENKENTQVPAGTLLVVSGTLEEIEGPRNPGEFDSRQYYACRHIYYVMKKAEIQSQSKSYSRYGQFLAEIRERVKEIFVETAKEAAPIFTAIVLGDKSALEEETKLRYQMAGIIHVICISGLHISILGMGLYELLKRAGLGIWPSGMISLVVILQYGVLTGESVSAMRAVCMFLIAIGAKILGRIYDMLTALSIAAILILLESPAYLYEGGFLLSFGAVVGAGVISPCLQKMTGCKKGKSLLTSLGVQLASLPVQLWFYGEVSLAGFLLNLIVIPTACVVLVSGLAAAAAGCVLPTAGFILALPGRAVVGVYDLLSKGALRLPFCTWVGGRPLIWEVVLYYGLLIGGLMLGNRLVKKQVKILPAAVGLVPCILAVLVLSYRPRAAFSITCLDVGQGDSAVIETGAGQVILIDGGSSSRSGIGRYQILPYLKYRGISYVDAIFISHTDADHINGISLLLELVKQHLTTIQIGSLVLPGWKNPPEEWQELKTLAQNAGIRVVSANAGDEYRAGKLSVKVLSPGQEAQGNDTNEEALVLQLEYGGIKSLFTGDIGAETEEKLLDVLEDVDILKVAHHGSRYSTCQAFLEKTNPETAVVSCSATNSYGHPAEETIERLDEAGAQVEYTMNSGAIQIETHGSGYRVRRFLETS